MKALTLQSSWPLSSSLALILLSAARAASVRTNACIITWWDS